MALCPQASYLGTVLPAKASLHKIVCGQAAEQIGLDERVEDVQPPLPEATSLPWMSQALAQSPPNLEASGLPWTPQAVGAMGTGSHQDATMIAWRQSVAEEYLNWAHVYSQDDACMAYYSKLKKVLANASTGGC